MLQWAPVLCLFVIVAHAFDAKYESVAKSKLMKIYPYAFL